MTLPDNEHENQGIDYPETCDLYTQEYLKHL